MFLEVDINGVYVLGGEFRGWGWLVEKGISWEVRIRGSYGLG